MSDLLIIGIIVLFGGLVVLALLGGVFWYLRQSAVEEKAPPDKAVKPKKTKPATQDEAGSAGQAPATAPASPASSSAAPPVAGVTSPPKLKDDQIGEKIRILIVDDNPDTRGHVSRLLYFEDDMEVIGQAINGREGIEQAIELKPHIVLMDINMPDINGLEVVRFVKQNDNFKHIPVIIVTTEGRDVDRERGLRLGADRYLIKPFEPEELQGFVRDLL